MTVNSQFLYFYIDELIKHHWVDWLEGPLSAAPPPQHRDVRGFQRVIGDTKAGPRTRAGEAYQLGILTGRIVKPQVSGASFPSGWQAVIDNQIPSTKLGFYSYVIGKALRENPEDPNLVRALDCLASIFVLHIAFQNEGRWFNTALIFQFAYDQLANLLGRSLTNKEVRYLAAAVINTLDSDERKILLTPYIADQPIENLLFQLNNGNTVHFELSELSDIVAEKRVGVNDFEKTKAALFGADPSRGIFMRATRSCGRQVIRELMTVDQKLAQSGEENLLEKTLGAIQSNHLNPGIFSVAEKAFADFPDLLREWQDLEAELFEATNKAVEAVDLDPVPSIWITAHHELRGIDTADASADDLELKEVEDHSEEAKEAKAGGDVEAEPHKKVKKKPRQQMELPSEKALKELVERELDEISVAAPVASQTPEGAKKNGKPRVTQTDFAEKEARNRKLGEAGEFFVFQYEIHKLRAAGMADLANRVQWVSKELGDGLGYDIRSFDFEGNELFLEVKTTTGGRATAFFVSNNEVAVSEEKAQAYRLVRVFDFPDKPRFFTLSGSLAESLRLEPTSYRARV